MSTYKRMPIQFERGEGIWLWDSEDRQYLDALSGIAVCGLGHAHPAVTRAIAEQAGRLVHTSNLYGIALQEQLADRLSEVSGMDRVFFSTSGAEANEAAIKIARLYGHSRGIDNPAIIVTDRSFHGRTMATLSATGNRKVQAGFEPLVPGFVRVPYNDLDAIRTVAENSDEVVAILAPKPEKKAGSGGGAAPTEVRVLDFSAGDSVTIIGEHAFAGLLATIDEVHPDSKRVKAFVEIFGRETPVELEFSNIQKN